MTTLAANAVSVSSVVATFIAALAAALTVALGYYPFYKKKKAAEEAFRRRVEAACDATLGKTVDLEMGRTEFHPGLSHIVPLNGYRMAGVPTLTDAINAAKTAAEGAESAANSAAAQMKDHSDADTRRFKEITDRLDKENK